MSQSAVYFDPKNMVTLAQLENIVPKTQMVKRTLDNGSKVEEERKYLFDEEANAYVNGRHYLVPFYDIVTTVKRMSEEHIDAPCIDLQISVSREGQLLCYHMTFGNPNMENNISIVGMSSYAGLVKHKFACGLQTMVCENLCVSGDIFYTHKHMRNAWDDLRNQVGAMLGTTQHTLQLTEGQFDQWKSIPLTYTQGCMLLGILAGTPITKPKSATIENAINRGAKVEGLGNPLLTPRQLSGAFKEWQSPSYPEFREPSLMNLYNSCTHVLKQTAPDLLVKKLNRLHNVFAEGEVKNIIDAEFHIVEPVNKGPVTTSDTLTTIETKPAEPPVETVTATEPETEVLPN
jgi:hypothetical protein